MPPRRTSSSPRRTPRRSPRRSARFLVLPTRTRRGGARTLLRGGNDEAEIAAMAAARQRRRRAPSPQPRPRAVADVVGPANGALDLVARSTYAALAHPDRAAEIHDYARGALGPLHVDAATAAMIRRIEAAQARPLPRRRPRGAAPVAEGDPVAPEGVRFATALEGPARGTLEVVPPHGRGRSYALNGSLAALPALPYDAQRRMLAHIGDGRRNVTGSWTEDGAVYKYYYTAD
jgi:hypothetical protein